MKRLLILGAGTAGTMAANKLRRRLHPDEWRLSVVDQSETHFYQPGYLFIPFGRYRPDEVSRPSRRLLRDDVDLIHGEIALVEPDHNRVLLTDGRALAYDYLVIATGTTPRPDQTPGMADGRLWRSSVFDFYTYDGAVALASALGDFRGGRMVVHVVDMPIKCPVAPLEFTFLADAYFRECGIRDDVELVYVTPLPGAFTKPIASHRLGSMLEERKIVLETDFMVESVDPDTKTLVSYDEREIPFDLLVTVPLNMGADYVAKSGLGNELNYVAVDKHTMLSKQFPNIFAIGDANDLPASKAGSVAHFSVEVFADNFVRYVGGKPMLRRFDGHANCFVESGAGKGLLIDFNYDTEPLPGRYPLPWLGPCRLLAESPVNHWGKLAFRWIYWHVLLPGLPVPLPSHLTMAGKHPEE
ncbi:type III sulfide quinone reductase, selenoprotein subtype [Fodinicola acaciae]|uniref:type III sulfide quinone reductase, selenoprotein subtype n=1 Tax=Fodinicola acaciae TaxID=2681555 RepID=UPI0013D1C2C4|nr:FAD/NAD(P)-binding oxidoreductase [Fodinicola acaciae]